MQLFVMLTSSVDYIIQNSYFLLL